MKIELKETLSFNKTLLILTLLTVLLGVLSCAFGELMLPLMIGTLSCVFLFDNSSKRIYRTVASVLLAVINLLAILFNFSVSFFGPAAIILSYMICSSFKKKRSKSDTAYIMTVIAALTSVLGYILFAMIEQGIFTLDAALSYYRDLIDILRVLFVDGMTEIYELSGIQYAPEAIKEAFDYRINMIISYLFVGGFVITGLGMKIFSAITRRLANQPSAVSEWRFEATKLYAYIYVILVLASLFVKDIGSLFAISVSNLYTIFTVVFAYIGFKTACSMLTRTKRPVVSVIILIILIVIFASFAIQILSALGVLYSLRQDGDAVHPKKPV